MKQLVLSFLLVCSFQNLSGAGKPYTPVEPLDQPWRVVSFLESAGLERRHLFNIDFQKQSGSDGYETVWIATSDGLHEYDGYDWKRHGKSEGHLPSDLIRSVLITRAGLIWVGSDRGAGVYDGTSYQTMGSEKALAGPNVRRIIEDPDGTIWFCSDGWPNAAVSGGLTSYKNGVWRAYGVKDGLPSDYVANYFRDSSGRQFVVTRDGVAQFERDRWVLSLPVDRTQDNFTSASFTESPEHGLLLSNGHKIFRFEDNRWHPLPVKGEHRYDILSASDGNVYAVKVVAQRRLAIIRLAEEEWKHVSAHFRSRFTAIEQLQEASDGSIWAIGNDLLIRWSRHDSTWTEFNDLPPPSFADRDGRVWFVPAVTQSTKASPVTRFADGEWDQLEEAPHSLDLNSNGSVWGWTTNTVTRWEGTNETRFEAGEVGLTRINLGLCDGSDRFWAIGENDLSELQVAWHDGEGWKTRNATELNDADARFRTYRAWNGLWLQTESLNVEDRKIYHLTTEGLKSFDIPIGLASTFYSNLYSSGKDTMLWMFGDNGLHSIKDDSEWTTIEGLPGGKISSVTTRGEETWITCGSLTSGNSGLVQLLNGQTTLHAIQSYPFFSVAYDGVLLFPSSGGIGLIPNSRDAVPFEMELPVRQGASTIVKDHENRIWIGGGSSVFRFTPDGIPPETRVSGSDTNVLIGNSVVFKAFALERGLAPGHRLGQRFSWKLDGGSWSDFSDSVEQRFPTTGLSTGEHQIQVRSQDAAMEIDQTPALVAFSVYPMPIQARTWFIPSVIAIGGILVFLTLIATRSRFQLAGHAQSLEETIVNRTRQLKSDIEQRKRTEEALRESQTKYEAVVSNAQDGIFMIGNGNIVFANEAGIRMSGWSLEEMLGKPFGEFIAPEFRSLLKERYESRIHGQEVVSTYDAAILSKDGTTKDVEVSVGLVDFGEFHTVVILRDISMRKHTEEEKMSLERQMQHAQKLESLGVLAGGIAHDFNNLLTTILGNASLARRSVPTDSKASENLAAIERGAARAAELTKQMLAYAGKEQLNTKPLDLSNLVKELAQLLQVSVSKKCALKYDLPSDLPKITGDGAQISQILMNLIINASEAIGDKTGMIEISIGIENCDRDYIKENYLDENLATGKYVCLKVSDTGSGMTEEAQSKLFDPFFTTKFTGRGLGMSAVLGIVISHKGAIKVSSEPGKGSTFRVFFPLSEQSQYAESQINKKPKEWSGKGCVLIVEDEESVRESARAMITDMGFSVIMATDGREGVETFRKHAEKVCLILTDLTMPQLNGKEFQHEIGRIRNDVPTILMSGYKEKTEVDGFAGFIQKPFTYEDLELAMQKALDI